MILLGTVWYLLPALCILLGTVWYCEWFFLVLCGIVSDTSWYCVVFIASASSADSNHSSHSEWNQHICLGIYGQQQILLWFKANDYLLDSSGLIALRCSRPDTTNSSVKMSKCAMWDRWILISSESQPLYQLGNQAWPNFEQNFKTLNQLQSQLWLQCTYYQFEPMSVVDTGINCNWSRIQEDWWVRSRQLEVNYPTNPRM